MRDHWIVPDAFGRTWRLWLPRGSGPAGLPPDQARAVIERLSHESTSAGSSRHDRLPRVMGEILCELNGWRHVQEERDVRELARFLEWAVRSGRLRVERTVERPRVFVISDVPPTVRESVPPVSEREPNVVDWVSLVVSDENGIPLPNVVCRVTAPGGEVRDTSSDQEGRVTLRGIESGSCTIDLPDIDAREWNPAA